jgi:N4-(beta-N-acetylglucosaminyl)-L-asparaginase
MLRPAHCFIKYLFLLALMHTHIFAANPSIQPPIVINTWAFTNATRAAWAALAAGGSALDAVEAGCSNAETQNCDGTVGYGGSPDQWGLESFDAMIMDGDTMEVGALGALQRVHGAVRAARRVLDHTTHSLMVGEGADAFAEAMGVGAATKEEVEKERARDEALVAAWEEQSCQPNFYKNVAPDPRCHCGPFSPLEGLHGGEYSSGEEVKKSCSSSERSNESTTTVASDTIAMAAMDSNGKIATACSTNGAIHKIHGRVGDGAVPGGFRRKMISSIYVVVILSKGRNILFLKKI